MSPEAPEQAETPTGSVEDIGNNLEQPAGPIGPQGAAWFEGPQPPPAGVVTPPHPTGPPHETDPG